MKNSKKGRPQLSKRKSKQKQRKLEALKKKREESKRRQAVMKKLKKNTIEEDLLKKMHSSKNLKTDFDHILLKKIEKEEKYGKTLEDRREEKKLRIARNERMAEERQKKEIQEKIEEINAGNKINLFNQASFSAPEVKIGKDRVVDEEKKKLKMISERVDLEKSLKFNNPFKEAKESKANYEDFSHLIEEQNAPILKEDNLVKQIQDLEMKNLASGYGLPSKLTQEKAKDAKDEQLPIYKNEFEIMESINNNLITIICGETGTGKSTQLPQILDSHGYTKMGTIGITQPRRLAAISLADRVSSELKEELGERVGYQVRFEKSRFSEKTRIKFMTDGILLNEMISDFMLRKYSCIIIDEAHERSINSDILIGLLSRVIRIRAKLCLKERQEKPKQETYELYPLRLVIMSATLRTSDFTENERLFPKDSINVINLESRTFRVRTFMEKTTPLDYVEAAVEKVKQIHSKLGQGGVLVFLTGEEEIRYFCDTLRAELEEMKAYRIEKEKFVKDDVEEELDEDALYRLNPEADEINEEGKLVKEPVKMTEEEESEAKARRVIPKQFVIYPLYSKLPLKEQQKVFEHDDPDSRLIVVSTNIAETSLTIKNIRFVVDTGKEKRKEYNNKNKIGRYIVDWASQSSANQRKGRAGRTANGFCYRLYSLAVFEKKFSKFSRPEILQQPLDMSLLKLKAIGINKIDKFPFVTLPEKSSVDSSIKELKYLKALDSKSEKITDLGRTLSYLPIQPRYGKLILMARSVDLLEYSIMIVASICADQLYSKVLLKKFYDKKEQRKREIEEKGGVVGEEEEIKKNPIARFWDKYRGFIVEQSDILTAANVLGNFMRFMLNETNLSRSKRINKKITEYCQRHCLIFKTVKETYSLILHIIKVLTVLDENYKQSPKFTNFFSNFKFIKETFLKQRLVEIITACSITDVARKVILKEENKTMICYETEAMNKKCRIHPMSVARNLSPDFILFTEAIEIAEDKIYLMGVTEIRDVSILHKYDIEKGNSMEQEPTDEEKPGYNYKRDEIISFKEGLFGPKLWKLPLFISEFEGSDYKKSEVFVHAFLNGKVFKGFSLKDNFKVITGFKEAKKGLVEYVRKNGIFSRKAFRKFLDNEEFKKKVVGLIRGKLKDKLFESFAKVFNSDDN